VTGHIWRGEGGEHVGSGGKHCLLFCRLSFAGPVSAPQRSPGLARRLESLDDRNQILAEVAAVEVPFPEHLVALVEVRVPEDENWSKEDENWSKHSSAKRKKKKKDKE